MGASCVPNCPSRAKGLRGVLWKRPTSDFKMALIGSRGPLLGGPAGVAGTAAAARVPSSATSVVANEAEAAEVLAGFGCCYPPLDYPPAQAWALPHYSRGGYEERQARFRQLRQARQEEQRSREVCGALGSGLPLLDQEQVSLLLVMQREAADLRDAQERELELCETGSGGFQGGTRAPGTSSLPSYAPNVPAGWRGPAVGPSGMIVGAETYFPVSAVCSQEASEAVGCLALRETPFESSVTPGRANLGPATALDAEGYVPLTLEQPSFRPDPISSLHARKEIVDRFRRAVNVVVAQNRALLSLRRIQKAFCDRLPIYQKRVQAGPGGAAAPPTADADAEGPRIAGVPSQVGSVMEALISGVEGIHPFPRGGGEAGPTQGSTLEAPVEATLKSAPLGVPPPRPDYESLLAELVDSARRTGALGCKLSPARREPLVPLCLPPAWASVLPGELGLIAEPEVAGPGAGAEGAGTGPSGPERRAGSRKESRAGKRPAAGAEAAADSPSAAAGPAASATSVAHPQNHSQGHSQSHRSRDLGPPLQADKALPLTMSFLSNTGEAPGALLSPADLDAAQFAYLSKLI